MYEDIWGTSIPGPKWGILGDKSPNRQVVSTRPPKDTSSRETPSFESSGMEVDRDVLSVEAFEKNKVK